MYGVNHGNSINKEELDLSMEDAWNNDDNKETRKD